MRVRLLSLLLLALLCCLAATTAAANAQPSAQRVYVGVYLHDVSRFDQRNGTFDVDAEIWARWLDDPRCAEVSPPPPRSCRYAFKREHLLIANAATVERTFLSEDIDAGWHSARWRVRGTLRGEFPLNRFPFDEQTLPFTFELSERHGVLVPDLASSGVATSFSLTDWLYEPRFQPTTFIAQFPSDLGQLDHEGQPTRVNRVAFQVTMRRPIVTVVLKIFLPLLIISLVAMAALFLTPKAIAPRAGMGASALLSCFAFQFTVAPSLPSVAYVTMADTVFLLAYVLSSLAVVSTVVSHGLFHGGRERASLWLDRTMRLLLPLGGLTALLITLPSPPEPLADPIEPPPQLVRRPSKRGRLRIGTTLLSRIPGSPLSLASSWSLVHTDPWVGPQTVFVDNAPGVANHALRFIAGGHIEVEWRLREGLRWSDGQPITAADIELPLSLVPDEHRVEVRRIDDRTLVIEWDERLSRALEPPDIWPAHVLGPIAQAPGEDGKPGGYAAVRAHKKTHPVPMLGPYRVTDFSARSHLHGSANPHFAGNAPNIGEIEVRYFADQDALVAAFTKGEIDFTAPNSVSLQRAQALRETKPDSVVIRPSGVLVFLQPDLSHPQLRKLAVRRALLMAIDRQTIVERAYGRAGRVAHAPMPEPLLPGTEKIPFDPEAARQILEREGAAGMTLPFFFRDAKSKDDTIESMIIASLQDAGVTIERKPTRKTMSMWRDAHHGGLLLHVLRARRDMDPRRDWSVPLKDGRYDPAYRSDAYTDEIHALVEREARALYPERKRQLRDRLIAATSQRLPTLPLLYAAERILAHPELQHWDAPPETPFGLGLEQWYFGDKSSE